MLTTIEGRLVQWWHGGDTGADRPLVVFFHGCPDTRRVAMTGHDAAVAAGVGLLCLNRPGYGSSAAHASTAGSVADDAVALARELGHEQFAVLGRSVGGLYAVACAARHPDRVSALGLVSPQQPDPEPGSVAEKVERFRPGFLEYVADLDPADPDDVALAVRFLERLPHDDDRAVAAVEGHVAVAASVREALATPEGYLRDAALLLSPWEHSPAEVSCPSYVWVGSHDARASTMPDLPGATVVRRRTSHLASLLLHWDDVLAALTH